MACKNIATAGMELNKPISEHGMVARFAFDIDKNGLLLTTAEIGICEEGHTLLDSPTMRQSINLAIQAIYDVKIPGVIWPQEKEWVK